MELIGLALAVLSLFYAFWQHYEARQSARRAEQAERKLISSVDELPRKVAEALNVVVHSSSKAGDAASDTPAIPSGFASSLSGALNVIDHVDLDNDGREELVIQYPGGAHGSVLQVFGFRDGEFVELGALGIGTPNGFQWGDFDGDGRLEIEGEETDWTAGEPYVSAPRLRLRWRWDGREFVEVARDPAAN